MTSTLQEDEVLSAAIAGVPRVAELIATIRTEDRSRALEVAEQSYLETAHAVGYKDDEARLWVSEIMWRLRRTCTSFLLRQQADEDRRSAAASE